MSETLTRLIGPLPAHYTGPSMGELFAHPGGPCPAWGGYRPLPVDVPLSWLSAEVQALVIQDGAPRGAVYRAHTSDTLLICDWNWNWHVAAPARPTRRAVVIAVDALQTGCPLPGGMMPEEAAEALRIHATGERAHSATLPWEREQAAPYLMNIEDMEPVYRRATDEE